MIGSITGFLLIFFQRYSLKSSLIIFLILLQSVMFLSRHLSTESDTIALASSRSSSASLTYTKPLVTISGPAISCPVYFSSVRTTMIIPFSARFCLSLNTIFPTSPTPSPSTKIAPVCTWSTTCACSSLSSSTSPDFAIIT